MSKPSKLKVHIIRAADFDIQAYENLKEFMSKLQKKGSSPFKFIFDNDQAREFKNGTVEKRKSNISTEELRKLLRNEYFANYFQNNSEAEKAIQKAYSKGEYYSSWHNLFDLCNEFRKEKKIPISDQVILLTHTNNYLDEENNEYFGANSEQKPSNNSFVHTNFWDLFLPGIDNIYPISYIIILLLIIKKTGIPYLEYAQKHTHRDESIGCLSDYTDNKIDIILKLRTGDICDACLEILKNAKDEISGKKVPVSGKEINSYLLMLDEIRNKTLFNRRALNLYENSSIKIYNEKIGGITKPKRTIFFEEWNTELDLGEGIEYALYLYLLNNEKGFEMPNTNIISKMTPKKIIEEFSQVINEMTKYYMEVNSINETSAKKIITNLFLPEKGNVGISAQRSRINKKIKEQIQDEEIQKSYEITFSKSNSGLYKIKLDRNLINWE